MMNGKEMQAVSPINAFAQRFTAELDDYARKSLPLAMTNEEYAKATAAMLLSLSRTMATCAVAFAKTHGVSRDFVEQMLVTSIKDNMTIAYDAVEAGESATVQ